MVTHEPLGFFDAEHRAGGAHFHHIGRRGFRRPVDRQGFVGPDEPPHAALQAREPPQRQRGSVPTGSVWSTRRPSDLNSGEVTIWPAARSQEIGETHEGMPAR